MSFTPSIFQVVVSISVLSYLGGLVAGYYFTKAYIGYRSEEMVDFNG